MRFKIEYYGDNNLIEYFYTNAKSKKEAVAKLRASNKTVLEIVCILNLDY